MRDRFAAARAMFGQAARLAGAGFALVLSLASTPCAAGGPPVTFGTGGGDAWTFEKRIDGTVSDTACDTVAITSPRGTVTATPGEGRFAVRVPLRSGDNPITAECRQGNDVRGAPTDQRWFVRLQDVPKARVHVIVADGRMQLDAGASTTAPVRMAPIVAYEWRARERNPAPIPGLPASGPQIELAPPPIDGEYYVTLRVRDNLGQVDESTAMFRVRRGKPEAVDIMREHAAWIDRAVVYGVVPSLFGPGGFRDVTARLNDLADLGVNTLWLSPIYESPPGDFGYAVTDYFSLRPNFGSEADLHGLIAMAHDRGMRVILDAVPNHVSDQHPYFKDAAARGTASAYYDFFWRNPLHYFDYTNLENLNYDNPEVRRMTIEAFARWVHDFDVDGFRVDEAWGPRERAPDFWPRWREELKRIKPDLMLLAEASARDPYYFRYGFDAAYDWFGEPRHWEWAWNAAFAHDPVVVELLRKAIADPALRQEPGALIFRFLNNNDTNPHKFIGQHTPELTRVAAAMLLTLPGVPGLFTGDEVGADYNTNDQFYRNKPIDWTDKYDLRSWYKRLLELRRDHPALRSGELRLLDVGPADQVLAYLRLAANDNILVLLNYRQDWLEVALPNEALSALTGSGPLLDLATGEQFPVSGSVTMPLRGLGVRILRRP